MNDKPWLNESDSLNWQSAVGYDCCILRGPMKSLCGYVRLPEDHPLYNVEYNAPLPESFALSDGDMRAGYLFDVHGSITFSGGPYKERGPGFWYGFDCAHAGDLTPTTAERYPQFSSGDEVYRDIEYAKAECESLAKQLKDLESLSK